MEIANGSERIGPIGLALTLHQMMKLVIFGAVASMCFAPMWRLTVAGAVSWPRMLLGEAVAIPMVLAIAAIPMIRNGPHKDWLIRSLLLTSVWIALASVIYALNWAAVGPSALNVWAGSGATRGFFRLVIVVLGVPVVLLVWQLVRGWCPKANPAPGGLPGPLRRTRRNPSRIS